MNEFDIIIKALEDQRNAALTQIVQLHVEKAKLLEQLEELQNKDKEENG